MKTFTLINLSLSLSIFILLFGGFSTKAQTSTYTVSGPTRGQGPLLNTELLRDNRNWRKIHRYDAYGGASVNSWSSAQSIGFPFSFYGSPVTEFCVSKNYLLTFNTTVAGTAVNTNVTTNNTALPNANLPNHTIAYFWSSFGNPPPINRNNNVWMKSFGIAPNRQLWIKNFSYECEDQRWSYNFVVLEETTHKIYVVDAGWARSRVGSYTVGVQLNSTTAIRHLNSPNIKSINRFLLNPWPNVDYYEFTPRLLVNDDAGVLSLDAPISPVTPGSQSIQVSIKNYGLNNLDSVRAGWSVDGVVQTPYSWTGNLAPNAVAASINIGSYNFTLGNPILKIWTSNPNGNPDNDTSNDTVEVSLSVCFPLSGTYTLGGVSGSNNFPSFDSLATLLNDCGVNGLATINVLPGTYREQFTLGNINGVSQTNTIIIDGGDTSLVTLTHSGIATVAFDSTSYVTLRNMTLENTKSSSAAWVVHLQNTDYIVIDSCLITQSVDTISDRGGILGSGSLTSLSTAITNNHLTISDNTILGWNYGVLLEAVGSDKDVGNQLLRNRFTNRSYGSYGIRVDGQDSLIISGNVIGDTSSGLGYGILGRDIMDFKITANNLFSCSYEGIAVKEGGSTGTVRSLIANNMVYVRQGEAIRMTGSFGVNIYHNTAVGNPAAMRFGGKENSDMNLYNNIFSNPYGVALDASWSLDSTIDIDYNLYQYQASRNIAEEGSTKFTDLSAWQTANSALNAHSVEGDPIFVRATSPADLSGTSSPDLHVASALANDTGKSALGIHVDIDGDPRPLPPSTRVDMGADEYHPATCLPSRGLPISAIGPTTAQLSWITGGASNWNLEWGTASFTLGSGNFLSNVSNPYTLGGLSSGTSYSFYVQDSCGAGDVSVWRGPVFFTTLCSSLSPAILPIIEGFESGSGIFQRNRDVLCYPTYKWSYETSIAEDGRLRFAISGLANSGNSAATLDKFFTNSPATTAINYLIMTADLSNYSSSLSGLELEFSYMHHREYNNPNDKVWIRGRDTDAWIQIYDLYVNQGTASIYNHVRGIDIDSILANATPPQRVSSTFQLRFGQEGRFGAKGSGNNVGYSFDDVAIRETCPSPTNLTVTHIIQIGATLSWVAGGASNWDLEYGLSGFPLGSGTRIFTTTPSYTVSGLTPGTGYDFYVRDSCGAAHVSSWAGPDAFITLSATLPCPSPSSLLASNITQTSARLSWMSGGTSTSNWDLEYGLSGFTLGSGTRISTTTPSYTVSGLTPGTGYDFYVRDSCGAAHVSSWAGPDAFTTLSATLPCPSPSSLLASNITQTSARLSWMSGGTSTSNWDLEYGLSGFPLGSGTRISTTIPFYTVSGLTPGQSYQFYVRDSCGVGHVSSWAGPYTVTTLSATLPCPSPSSLGATNITQTSATLSWMSGGTSTSNWDLEYGLSGFPLGSGTRISTTIPFYTMSSLTPGQSYQFYVRDSCGVGHVSSWAGPYIFTTLSATLPCPSPSSLGATNITQTSARLSWMSGGTSTSNWDLEYGLSGFTLGSGTRISTTTLSYTVSGLTLGRSYQFYVRDSCGAAHVSSWAGPHIFRTLGCLAPTGLKIDTITKIIATVSWTSGGASNWNIEYGPINFLLGSGIFLYNVSSPRILRGLKPNTFYDVYVQDSCNVGNVSNWAGPLSIKTIIGIDELLERSFRIYPNPSEGAFKLEFSSSLGEDMEIRITNMMGQIVLEDEIESFSRSYRKRLEMGAYRSGVYLLQLITEKATVNRRIILQ